MKGFSMFSKIWQFLTAAAGLLAGFFFIKSKIDEHKNEKLQDELDKKELELDAANSKVEVAQRETKNEQEIKEFIQERDKQEDKIDQKTATEYSEIEKQVNSKPDGQAYKVVL